MSKELNDLMRSLSARDIEALRSIYNYRCLTVEQLYQLHYMRSLRDSSEIVSDAYCKKKVGDFLSGDIVQKVEHPQGDVLFLTTKGVDIVKHHYDLPTNIYNYAKNAVRSGYYRAAELKISPKYINHQLSLNQFMIDFTLRDMDVSWKYYDEKHMSNFNDIRPDGLLNMLDTDYFIEMDMATESKKQLYEKWENYRRFLNSSEFHFAEKKIVVLFVIENTARPQARIDLVKHTLGARLMDKLDPDFEIYINTKDEILDFLEKRVRLTRKEKRRENDDILESLSHHEFSVVPGEELRDMFNGIEYDFYIRKTNEENRIIMENDKLQEFLVDSYRFSPFSVLKKITFLSVSNIYFKENLGRELSYIIVGESENLIYRDLNILDLIMMDKVYYTTPERLSSRPFHKALFQFDSLGNVYHFKNSGLDIRVYEKTVDGTLENEETADQEMGGNL